MFIRKIFLILLFCLPVAGFSQSGKYSGRVVDLSDGQPIPLVNILASGGQGAVSNEKGEFIMELPPGEYSITFSFVGYANYIDKVRISSGAQVNRTIRLSTSSKGLSETVVTASRYNQNVAEVPVSIESLKGDVIEKTNAHELEEVMMRVPGVMMMDGQASIRGGSGYAYGTGSRVLMLLDGMPLLTGASGEAMWDFLPMNNIERIEVLKGASSVLYGSSAMNGTVNISTRWPGIEPETRLSISTGMYSTPQRPETQWWGREVQSFSGIDFSQARAEGPLDIITGLGAFTDDGYREQDHNSLYRAFLKTRYRHQKIQGLSAGLTASLMEKQGQNFLLWQDGDSNVLKPNPVSVIDYRNTRFHIDPFVQYFRNEKMKHLFQGRYYWVDNSNESDQNSRESVLFGEYQFLYRPAEGRALVAGFSAQRGKSAAQLFGDSLHFNQGLAAYVQHDRRIGKLILTAGARWEWFRLDNDPAASRPVFRAGANYPLTRHSHLRASFGQGFRYPSVAEKYTLTQVGALKIFPNPDLMAEKGWSSELGLRQDFRLGNLKGYADVALFWMEYSDMIEFSFGQHYPDSIVNPGPFDFINYTGFKAFNIGPTRINGVEFSSGAAGRIAGLPAGLMLAYTFSNPIDPDFNPDSTNASTSENILKYRSRHLLKCDAEVSVRRFTFGAGLLYFSHIVNIDKAFEDTLRLPNGAPIIQGNGKPLMIMPELHEYRLAHNSGEWLLDLRISYNVTRDSKATLVIKNILNREYMIRPGMIEAPRNIALQYNVRF